VNLAIKQKGDTYHLCAAEAAREGFFEVGALFFPLRLKGWRAVSIFFFFPFPGATVPKGDLVGSKLRNPCGPACSSLSHHSVQGFGKQTVGQHSVRLSKPADGFPFLSYTIVLRDGFEIFVTFSRLPFFPIFQDVLQVYPLRRKDLWMYCPILSGSRLLSFFGTLCEHSGLVRRRVFYSTPNRACQTPGSPP